MSLTEFCDKLLFEANKGTLLSLGRQIVTLSQVMNSMIDIYNKRRITEPTEKEPDPIVSDSIPHLTVESPTEVPDAKLYYVKQYEQYAVRINGHLIHGNIGIIGNKQSTSCKYHNKCKTVLSGKICKYYHDVSELVHLRGLLTCEAYQKIMRHYKIPYFSKQSFLHDTSSSCKVYNCAQRKLGNRTSLEYDICKDIHNDVDNRPLQLAHDMLIWLVMCKRNLFDIKV